MLFRSHCPVLVAAAMVFAGIGYCFTLVCQKMASIVSQGSGTDVRNALFEKVNELSSADVDDFGTPSLVTRITNDVNQVQVTIALGVRQLIRWPLLAVGSMSDVTKAGPGSGIVVGTNKDGLAGDGR